MAFLIRVPFTPKRRWFRFNLRTLFVVVTVVGCIAGWLLYQVRWIVERRHVTRDRVGILHATFDDDRLPWPLWLLPEDGWSQINYAPDLSPERKAELTRLFPEATLVEGPWKVHGTP
jgi:hypothetical protein